MHITQIPSPNFGPRIGYEGPDMIVIHYTGMESAQAAIARLCDPEPEVSAHYVVEDTGDVCQLVSEAHRAWHAGLSVWAGETDINSCSIGIELCNPGSLQDFPPFPEPQMAALAALIADIQSRWDIPKARILGHEHVAPGRKFDPGPKFDWGRLGLNLGQSVNSCT